MRQTDATIERLELPAPDADEDRRAKPRPYEGRKLAQIAWLLENSPDAALTGAITEVAAALTESDRALLAPAGVTE